MMLKKYGKPLLGLLLVVMLYRLFFFELPAPAADYNSQDDSYRTLQDVPQLPEQRDQQAMRERVLQGDVWGWPDNTGTMTPVPENTSEETEPEIPGWRFVGVVFDGSQWHALLILSGDEEQGTQKLKAGDSLPSGQSILDIMENEMLITVSDDALSAFVSETSVSETNVSETADDKPMPYAELQQQAEQGNSKVLVKVGFNFEQ